MTLTLFGIDAALLSNIIFMVTGGLLSLVGLIAIYVSINRQQNIQKAKEYIWELQSFILSNEKFDNKSSNRLRWIFKHYTDLLLPDKPIIYVISLAVTVISFCGVTWLVFVLYTLTTINHILFYFIIFSLIILICFIIILILLTRTSFIGNLPKPESLTDLYSTEQGIDIAEIFFNHAKLTIDYDKTNSKIRAYIYFPVQIKTKGAKIAFLFNNSIYLKYEKPDYSRVRPEVIPPDGYNDHLVFYSNDFVLPINENDNFRDLDFSLFLFDKQNDKNLIMYSSYSLSGDKLARENYNKATESYRCADIYPVHARKPVVAVLV